jgi:hypothetical protein
LAVKLAARLTVISAVTLAVVLIAVVLLVSLRVTMWRVPTVLRIVMIVHVAKAAASQSRVTAALAATVTVRQQLWTVK